MANERFLQRNYFDNLGISYSAGTFTIKGANGRDLSTSNPAIVVLQSKNNPGEFVRYNIISNQSFIDDAGASEIIGNRFGWTTSVAITVDVPFYLYACSNDAQSSITFGLSRIPGFMNTPATANIGTPSNAIADICGSMFLFSSVTTTEYDENPCLCIGSIRMQMSASDDWTVQTLDDNFDGIGMYQENNVFTMPLGQLGANSGTYTVPNTGTPPVFSTSRFEYAIANAKANYIWLEISLSADGGTDGAGSVQARVPFPYPIRNAGTGFSAPTFGSVWIRGTGGNGIGTFKSFSSNKNQLSMLDGSGIAVFWDFFGAGNRDINGTVSYVLDING